MDLKSCNFLSLILRLAAIHSVLVGLGLMAIPPSRMTAFGLQGNGERFFQAQGGIFHLLMAAIYTWAAVKQLQARELVILVIVIKSVAAVFLVTYYLAVQTAWIVLGSAATDALMAALIYWAFVSCERKYLQRLGQVR